MAAISMREALEAGVHFGHQTRRWNPKMKRYIYGSRNGIYIMDLHQTISLFDQAQNFDQAREAYRAAQADPHVAQLAPMELTQAGGALNRARPRPQRLRQAGMAVLCLCGIVASAALGFVAIPAILYFAGR